jgi:four helix bundle protein
MAQSRPLLPHHRLIVYQRAIALLLAVKEASIRDAKLRDESSRAAKSACLNIAEGASRASRADRGRSFTIARAEAMEAVAAVEIAALTGDAAPESATLCVELGNEIYALLTTLIR